MDKSTLKTILPLAITTAASLCPVPANSNDIYMDVGAGAIKGDVTSAGHENQIGILSWGWGVSNDQAAGTANMQSIAVVKNLDSATGPMIDAVISNKVFKEVVIYTHSPLEVAHCDTQELKLIGARFSSSSVGYELGSGVPAESYTLDFNEVCLTFRDYDEAIGCVVKSDKCYVK